MRSIDYLDKQAALHPDRALLVTGDQSITYAAMQALTHRVAGAMLAAGMPRQARVAILSPNDPAVVVAMLGLWRADAVWIPVNTRNAIDANIAYLAYVGADGLFYHSSLRDDALRMQAEVPSLRHMVCLDLADGDVPSLDAFMLPAGAPAVADAGNPNGNDEDLAAIIATGGTTGPAKGVRATNRSWGTMLETICHLMPCDSPPVFLATAPLTHAAGPFTLAGIAMGATVVVHPGFDAGAVLRAFANERVTHIFLPPTALYTMLAHPEARAHDYSALRYFLLAGSPVIPDRLREAVEVFGPAMCQSYGQTEFHLIATWLPPHIVAAAAAGDHPERLASCGRATPSVRVELMDDDGDLLPLGEVGEIVGRGGIVGGGYHALPGASAEAAAHGWHHTGDVGRRDADGYYYIVDRKKDMIVTGGFNVYSAEVEAVVAEMPGVHECAVIGIPDAKWGEAVTALVVAAPGQRPDPTAIIAHCKARLGSVKAPKHLYFRDAIPRTAVGKVDKKTLRAEFWGGHDRAVN